MGISEKKMQIVINNYFKQECDVNTSIREAFEKGFRIGIKKASSAQPEPPADVVPVVHAYWRNTGSGQECSACKEIQYGYDTGRHFCANCGAKMDGERKE